MLSCRACLWRCIQALETSPVQTHRLRRDGLSALVAVQQRSHTSSARADRTKEARSTEHPNVENASKAKGARPREKGPWEESKQAQERTRQISRVVKQGPGKQMSDTEMWLGKRDPRVSAQDFDRRRRELQYLHDPLEVATFVKKELGKGRLQEMLQLVRMAGHSMQVVVSWNHIIDHLMAKERMTDALKLYNEMKKRAQFPDSYTYTILLRGLASNAHHSGALTKALSTYHSLAAPNSRVKPTFFHTNAVLTVCARALDMDALWSIAARIPEKGPGAANATTFTIILNAIRQSLLVGAPHGETDTELAHRRERGVVQGRRLWEDIVAKWKNADLIIEEELVCAMGRLLLAGSRPRDWDDVLSLVEQTMDIPRLVPRLGTIARQSLPRIRATYTPQDFKVDDDHLGPDNPPMRGDEFLPLALHGSGNTKSSPLTYATPSNDTLSMVQEACQKVVAIQAADEYWNMLTDPGTYAIVPDTANLHQRLRLLRINRASAAALKMIREDFVAKGLPLKPGTFRIAMSTCIRDKNNHNSLRHASQLLQLMMETLPNADAKASTMYAELAVSFPLAKGEDLISALTFLQPVLKSLRIQLSVGVDRPDSRGVGTVPLKADERQDAIGAIRKIYAVYDRILSENLIAEEQKAPFKAERAKLSALLHRITFKDSNSKWERAKEAVEGNPTVPVEEGKDKKEGSRGQRGPGGTWRTRRVLPPDQRKPWSSTAAPLRHDAA